MGVCSSKPFQLISIFFQHLLQITTNLNAKEKLMVSSYYLIKPYSINDDSLKCQE